MSACQFERAKRAEIAGADMIDTGALDRPVAHRITKHNQVACLTQFGQTVRFWRLVAEPEPDPDRVLRQRYTSVALADLILISDRFI